jgi:hypothetical protein
MIRLLFAIFIGLSAHAVEVTSNAALKQIGYDNFANETQLSGDLKFLHENTAFAAHATLQYLYSSEYEEKRYLLLNELVLNKEHEDYTFFFGKRVVYWGELEGFNIADVYNQKNYLLDPFDKSAKIGAWGFNISKYFGENTLEFGVKFYEESQKFPNVESPFYPFFMKYDDKLQLSDTPYSPTFHLKYNFAENIFSDSQIKLILLHGYDNKRYFMLLNPDILSQFAYKVVTRMHLATRAHKHLAS